MISREHPIALELKSTALTQWLLRDATEDWRGAHGPAIVAEMATMAVNYRLSGKGE